PRHLRRDTRGARRRPIREIWFTAVVLRVRCAHFVLLLAVACRAADFSWATVTPAQEGFSETRLNAAKDRLAAHKTRAFLVLRHDRIVYEWYAPGSGPETLQGTASLAKALVGGMSLLAALDSGRIALDDLASKYIPAWKNDPLKRRITIRQLASHSSG